MNWIKKNKSNFILIIFSLIFALVLAEIFLRIVISPQAEFGIVKDEILGYKAMPNTGWDDNGFLNESIPESVDIVIMGDSQTQGVNATMTEAWPQVLSQISGYSTYQMAFIERGVVQHYYLLNQALDLNPDYVLLGFYMGNDLLDAYNLVYKSDYWQYLRQDDISQELTAVRSENVREMVESGLKEDSLRFKILKLRNSFRENSMLYTLLANASRGLREKLGLSETIEEKEARLLEWSKQNPDLAFVYEGKNQKTIMSPSYRIDTLDLTNKNTAEGWRISRQLLLEMKDIISKQNRDFIIVLIPTKERVYVDFMKLKQQEVPDSLSNIVDKEKEVLRVMQVFCSVNNIKCIDVSPDLSQALFDGQKIYPESLDGHPLATGYRVIAESVNSFLQQLQLKENTTSTEEIIIN